MEMQHLKEWEDDLHRCIRCGYCFEGCPVMKELEWEVDGARGKLVMSYGLLVGDLDASEYIAEKLFQCTFCKDCVERCSANVSVPDIIAAARADLWSCGLMYDAHKTLLNKISSSGNIFNKKLRPPDRQGETSVLLGCRFVERKDDAEKYLALLEKMDLKPKTFDEICCGMPFAIFGDRKGFQNQKKEFIESLPDKNEEVICVCTTCVFFIQKKYPDLKAKYIVEEIIERLPRFKNEIKKLNITATYHDPCNVARGLNMVDEPRWLLEEIGVHLVEMKTNGKEAMCCGGGGGLIVSDEKLSEKMAVNRVNEALDTGAEYLVTLCPTCELNLKKAALKHNAGIQVKNVLDLVFESVVGNQVVTNNSES